MLRRPFLSLVAAAVLGGLVLAPAGHAQLSLGGTPPSAALDGFTGAVPTLTLPPVDTARLLAADAAAPEGTPYRFGAAIPVDVDLKRDGAPVLLPSGATVWRLRITSPGAFSLGLGFARFMLPEGALLFVYDDARDHVLGAYSALNDKESGEFAIEPLPGEALTLEYVEPDWVSFPGEVRLAEVVHDYRGAFAAGGAAYSAAGACEVDVNCPQGANFQDEKRAVALIIAGGFLCTGSLINDTANDGTQYFWTANHCGNMNNAVFRFNYERSGCGSGGAPTNQTVQGSVLIANNTNIDYRLIRITESIPASYGVYYLGWNRSTSPGGNTITIHHPEGDVKKISFDNDPPSISGVQWKISQWDLGVTEPGSSGCCLLDPSGRLIGQLYGGQAACGFPFNDFYGRFDQAWGASAAIRSALDPLGGAPVTQAGFDPNGVTPGTWTDLGFALAGLLGNPQLVGTGPLLGGQNVTLSLTNARPFSTTALVIGLSAINASFKGGTLVPFPDVVVGGISTGGAGNVPITFAWPTGLPSGFTTRFQHWIVDSTGPAGLSASNAVAGTTP